MEEEQLRCDCRKSKVDIDAGILICMSCLEDVINNRLMKERKFNDHNHTYG